MAVKWERRHFGTGTLAYDAGFLVGQVAEYSHCHLCDGGDEHAGKFFVGFLRGHRVTDRCASIDAAQAVVEDVIARQATS